MFHRRKTVVLGDKRGSYVGYKPNVLGLTRSKQLEWIIPNGLGGYSSSTIINMNTSLYHGLLVSADEYMNKKVFVQKIDEEIITEEETVSLASDMYEGDNVSDGWRFLINFDYSHYMVFFDYSVLGVKLTKSVSPVHGRNAVVVSYTVHNKRNDSISVRINPRMNFRGLSNVGKKSVEEFQPNLFSENIVGVDSSMGYLTLYSDVASCMKNPQDQRWNNLVYYPLEGVSEHLCSPLYFTIELEPKDTQEINLYIIGYPTEKESAQVFKELFEGKISASPRIFPTGKGEAIMALLNSVEHYMLDAGSKKTIASSYPHSMDKAREALISLPGFTLINRRFRDAEHIMEHYLNRMDYRGIPSAYVDGKPHWGDIDSPLWLIDRFHRYMKCVGDEEAQKMLHTHWWGLKKMMKKYAEMESNGLLCHKGGTWMDVPHVRKKRENAVEVQGLWFNALNIMRELSKIMGDDVDEIGIDSLLGKFRDNFVDRYWRGGYLADSSNDDALRPNQLIAISLEFNVVNKTLSKKILNSVKRDLLTSHGLRSLSPEDDRYEGRWSHDPKNRFNGNVYPWLMGAYIDVFLRCSGSLAQAKKMMDPLYNVHMREDAVGTISECFQGDPPHRAKGNLSYSCSVAELLRIHFQHIVG